MSQPMPETLADLDLYESKSSFLATTKAVAFAEDARCDALELWHQSGISLKAMNEVQEARDQVRRIAAAGTPAQESM